MRACTLELIYAGNGGNDYIQNGTGRNELERDAVILWMERIAFATVENAFRAVQNSYTRNAMNASDATHSGLELVWRVECSNGSNMG